MSDSKVYVGSCPVCGKISCVALQRLDRKELAKDTSEWIKRGQLVELIEWNEEAQARFGRCDHFDKRGQLLPLAREKKGSDDEQRLRNERG